MNSIKSAVWGWFKQKAIPEESLAHALSLACDGSENQPSQLQWRTLTELLLTWGAALLIGAGLVFFIAANWQNMGRFERFALLESSLVIVVAIYILLRYRAWKNGDRLGFGYTSANAALLAVSIIIGSLLALVGQTYQTGADPWQLFALWALFALPIAWLAGSELLWLLQALLLNLTVVLYYQTFPSLFGSLFLFELALGPLFILNLLLHLGSLLLSGKLGCLAGNRSLNKRFDAPILQQLTIAISVLCITLLAVEAIFDEQSRYWLVVYFGLFATGYWLYNFALKQIFVLAIGGFSLVAVFNSLLTRLMFETSEPVGLFLVLGLTIIGSTTWLTIWLRSRHQIFQDEGAHND
ncbi:DUF2157 domain-containing protein [Shewanella schlegeliana]|uniref:DUF2157 domain-containing protein n=1 Tax=Shewanella schlegeliana TaxID=190308 RepID=A0ABS1T5I2_9GAMM|nr:DUF2157 domain-containing protein [Shewanella schlegeliana]MBL4915092.1 DUF2157 domain-containing protein [Shewanella schlegeliana]MCL1111042.1 DUF2157 domain-containing protein [Shewanella schlegeliana]GIU29085.1 hypothetical protein TUM4433_17920 [Shewanella schlegeliana]